MARFKKATFDPTEVRAHLEQGKTYGELATLYNVSESTMRKFCHEHEIGIYKRERVSREEREEDLLKGAKYAVHDRSISKVTINGCRYVDITNLI